MLGVLKLPRFGAGETRPSGDQELGAQAAQGAAQQPRHVHLGAADPGGDVVLVEVVEEAQDHDLPLRLGQAVQQLGQQQQVLQLLAGGGRSPSEVSPSSPICWSRETSERVWATSNASSASSSEMPRWSASSGTV